jgi:hypothetical protein
MQMSRRKIVLSSISGFSGIVRLCRQRDIGFVEGTQICGRGICDGVDATGVFEFAPLEQIADVAAVSEGLVSPLVSGVELLAF